MMRILSFLAALLALAGCSPLAVLNTFVPNGGFDRHAEISYAPGDRHGLDVYVPRGGGATPSPVIVFFYGGAWDSGERGHGDASLCQSNRLAIRQHDSIADADQAVPVAERRAGLLLATAV